MHPPQTLSALAWTALGQWFKPFFFICRTSNEGRCVQVHSNAKISFVPTHRFHRNSKICRLWFSRHRLPIIQRCWTQGTGENFKFIFVSIHGRLVTTRTSVHAQEETLTM
ncbi:hypothetical protein CPC08DRAFT_496262 [Agrocybe pediades]|nr:hypothetical protein CPC08DRAFT_496262 [Agrocybe pediades]